MSKWWWRGMKKKGLRLIRMTNGSHVVVHKTFKGTMEDLIEYRYPT